MNKIGLVDGFIISIFGFILYGVLTYTLLRIGFGESAFFLGLLGLLIYPTFKRYHRIGWKNVRNDIKELERKATETIRGLFYLAIFIIVAGLLLWGGWKVLVIAVDAVTPDTWTLMVCKDKLNFSECSTNSYVIPGFNSKKDCMLEGASRFSKEGFECGSNCKTDYGTLNVCSEVCNKAGCRK